MEKYMLEYRDKIQKEGINDLNWLLMVKKSKVEKGKNVLDFLLIFIFPLFIGLLIYLKSIGLTNITSMVIIWILFIGMGVGIFGYKKILDKRIAEIEVLKYLKKQESKKP